MYAVPTCNSILILAIFVQFVFGTSMSNGANTFGKTNFWHQSYKVLNINFTQSFIKVWVGSSTKHTAVMPVVSNIWGENRNNGHGWHDWFGEYLSKLERVWISKYFDAFHSCFIVQWKIAIQRAQIMSNITKATHWVWPRQKLKVW